MTINSKAGSGQPSTRHAYSLRKQIGFDVELALSALGEPHQVELDDQGGAYDLEVIITTDPLASLRADSAWSVFAVTPGVPTAVPLGTRKLAVQITAINSDAPKPTVQMVTLAHRGTESGRYYGVDQPTLPAPVGPSGPQPPPTPFAWWDGSDLSTLFQDTAGTVPTALNGDLVRYMANKGVGASHALKTGVADTDVVWLENFQNGLGGIHCTVPAAQIGELIDVSMTNGAWTQAVVASVSVPTDFPVVNVGAYKSFFQGFGVASGDCFVVKDPVGSEVFTDSNPAANQVFGMIMSWQSGGQLDAICSLSTQIKSVVNAPYVEPLSGDTTLIGGGILFSGVKNGELLVYDALKSFATLKQYHFDKWGITYA